MGFLEEMEWRFGGRLKSALILLLSAALVSFYAGGRPAVSVNTISEESGGQYDNPIDRYFMEAEERLPENMHDRWQQLYLDAWEMELAHAYELMREDMSESFFAEGGYGQTAAQTFGEFLEAEGYLEGYYAAGITGERDIVIKARLELARAQTKRLYEQIRENREREGTGEMGELYRFTP